MSFGKKKSNLPQAKPRPIARDSRKRVNSPWDAPQQTAAIERDLDANTIFSLEDTARLVAGLCEARGYPDFTPVRAAHFTIWLESRGIPSHGSLLQNILLHWDNDLRDRGVFSDAHGGMIMKCPLIGAAIIGKYIKELVEAGPGKKINFICEGPIHFLLPRISEHASDLGVALMVEIQPPDHYIENPTHIFLHEGELALRPGETSFSGPANVLVRVIPPEHIPPKSHFNDDRLKRETVIVQSVLIDLVSRYRRMVSMSEELPFKDGIPSELDFAVAIMDKPKLRVEMSETTKNFFHSVIDTNSYLRDCFAKLSKGNKSNLGAIVFETNETKDLHNAVLVTTKDSNTGVFYIECEKLGWMQPAHEAGVSEYGFLNYQVTKTGLMGLSLLLAYHSSQ